MNSRYLIPLLVIFLILVYFMGLVPETTVDSAKYASVSREIYESGDFIHLRIHGEPYLQKPPLLFWLAAISFRLFGLSMFAFKLPTLLFSLLGIYSVYRLGRLCFNKGVGMIAATIYATSEALLLYSMDVHTDLLLTSNIIFGSWQLAEYLRSGRRLNFVLGFVGIGLAMLSKGVIGLAIPVFAIGGYLLLKRDFKTIFSLKWIAGLFIIAILLYPALKGLYDQFGTEGIKFFFWSNNIDRIRGDYSDNRHDYLFFIHTFLYLFLPWSLYSILGFFRDLKSWRAKKFTLSGEWNSLNYSAFIPLALIVSVSSQQSPHYLLPVIPFISVITGAYISDLASGSDKSREFRYAIIFRNIVVVFLWVIVLMVLLWFFPTANIPVWIIVIFMLLILAAGFVLSYQTWRGSSIL